MLETLTKKQEVLLHATRQKWIKFALLSGDRLNIKKFKEGISFIYAYAKLRDPIKVYVDSPLGLQYACQILKKIDFNKIKSDQVRDQVSDQVRDQVSDQVRDQVRDQVSGQVYGQVRGQYESFSWLGSGWDSGWLSFYDYFDSIKIKVTDDYKKYRDFIKSGVYDTILFNNFAIGCRRPNYISRDELNRMHSEERSAISWRDGFELYYLWGVNFTKELWQKVVRKELSFKQILAIGNIEQRMCTLKILGTEELLENADAKLLDKSERGNELYLVEDIFNQPAYFLKYKCPSTDRIYVKGVDPEIGKKGSADECQAWSFGLELKQYEALKIES